MGISSNCLYKSDVQKAAQSIDTKALDGQTILITGATGLIGSAIVDVLLWKNRNEKSNIKIYAASRSPQKIDVRFEGYDKTDGLFAVRYDACEAVKFEFHSDYIIHAASNASPDAYIKYPVDTMLSNVLGMNELLKYAIHQKTRKAIYVSSSEVYGVKLRETPIEEEDYGRIDILNPRASYSVGKQATETLCVSYAHQFGCDISIVRPGHIYGPTAIESDQRASSAFARLAADKRDIVMKSPGKQIRSYCHCLDCATAILTVLLYGKNAEAYNISNKNSIITIHQMAELLAQYGGVSIKNEFPSNDDIAAFNPMENSSLDSTKLEGLGWKGIFSAEEGLSSTVEILRNIRKHQGE